MFLFPTTVMCVDDRKIFLQKFSQALSPHLDTFFFRYFQRPEEAMHVLSSSIHPWTQMSENMNKLAYDYRGGGLFRCVHAFVHNPQRYSVICAVVTDQQMPGMKGMAIMEQTPDHIYKVMLSSHMTPAEAIESLNRSRIHYFIAKEKGGEDKAAEQIAELLPLIRQRFFFKNECFPSFAPDDVQDTVLALAKEYQAIEVYALDMASTPVFLMITCEGHEYMAHIFRPDTMFGNLGSMEKSLLSQDLLKKVRSGKLGYCGLEFDRARQPKKPKDCFKPLTPLASSPAAKHMTTIPWGFAYHVTDLGLNVYSKGSFTAFKKSQPVQRL